MELVDNKRQQFQAEQTKADRISLLPDDILLKILALLPSDGSAERTSSLSKRWEALWHEFPYINLIEENNLEFEIDLLSDEEILRCREQFTEMVRLAFLRRSTSNLEVLNIETLFPGDEELHLLVHNFICDAMRGGLKNLLIQFTNEMSICPPPESFFKLPEEVLALGSSCLENITLEGCLIESFSGVISLQQLQTLSMDNVHIPDQMLYKLIRGCPVITSLCLRRCHELKALCLSHDKVKSLLLESCQELVEFMIKMPNLEIFRLKGAYVSSFTLDSKSVLECSCLKKLQLSRVSTIGDTLEEMVKNLPTVEILKLKDCSVSSEFRLSGKNLKKLFITDCIFDEQVDFSQASGLQFLRWTERLIYGNRILNHLELKYLTHLEITGYVIITDISLSGTVENCPVLQSLVLQGCAGLNAIVFTSQSLENLYVIKCVSVTDIIIVARNLKMFKYDGPPLINSEVVPSSELTADIKLSYFDQIDDLVMLLALKNFLHMLSYFAKTMFLDFKDCPSVMRMLEGGSESPIRYLDVLKVRTSWEATSLIQLLRSVLRISVCRKTLCIEVDSRCNVELEFRGLNCEERYELWYKMNEHDCLREHLIEARIKKFKGQIEVMRLVKFLLGRGERLKIMSIYIDKDTFADPVRRSQLIEWKNNLSEEYRRSEIVLTVESGNVECMPT